MNLHRILFPKCEERESYGDDLVEEYEDQLEELRKEIEILKAQTPEQMENIMRASLGLPYIRFDNIEKDLKGSDNPPHYLKGLTPDARTAFLAELSQIYKKPEFQTVMNYHINVLGNHSIQKAKDEDMRNGRIGIIALRGFRKELEDANTEYLDSLKQDEDFDKHSILSD